jgi:hypothetical protein
LDPDPALNPRIKNASNFNLFLKPKVVEEIRMLTYVLLFVRRGVWEKLIHYMLKATTGLFLRQTLKSCGLGEGRVVSAEMLRFARQEGTQEDTPTTSSPPPSTL